MSDSYFDELEDIETDYLCKCNNCGVMLRDQNPQTDAPQYELDGSEECMEWLYDPEEDQCFWGCPNCETDGYLMDLE